MANTYSSNGTLNKILVKGNSFKGNNDAERKSLGLLTQDELKKRKAEFDAKFGNKKTNIFSGSVDKDKISTAFGYSPNSFSPVPQVDYTKYTSTTPVSIAPTTPIIADGGMSTAPGVTYTVRPAVQNKPTIPTTTTSTSDWNSAAGSRANDIVTNVNRIAKQDQTLLSNRDSFNAKFGYVSASPEKKKILDDFFNKNRTTTSSTATTTPTASTTGTSSTTPTASTQGNYFADQNAEAIERVRKEKEAEAARLIALGDKKTEEDIANLKAYLKPQLAANKITYDEYIKKLQGFQDEALIAKGEIEKSNTEAARLQNVANSANIGKLDGQSMTASAQIAAAQDLGIDGAKEVQRLKLEGEKAKATLDANLQKFGLSEKETKEKKAELEAVYQKALTDPILANRLSEIKTLTELETFLTEMRTSKDKKYATETEAKDLTQRAAGDYAAQWATSTPDQRKQMAYNEAIQAKVKIPPAELTRIINDYANDWTGLRAAISYIGDQSEANKQYILQALATEKITLEEAIAKQQQGSTISNTDLNNVGTTGSAGFIPQPQYAASTNTAPTEAFINPPKPKPPLGASTPNKPTVKPSAKPLSATAKKIIDKLTPEKKAAFLRKLPTSGFSPEVQQAYRDYLK